jgi:hypothetical protein
MANLVSTTATTFNATTSTTTGRILCTAGNSMQMWAGYVGIETPFYSANNYADLICNTNGYNWIMGLVFVGANQSYNSSHSFWFALSRYGVKYATGPAYDGLIGLGHYQDPNNANNNFLRFYNTYNASWAYGNYHFCCTIFSGGAEGNVTSSFLTRII